MNNMINKKILLVTFFAISCLVVIFFVSKVGSAQSQCTERGGTYSIIHNECEDISREACFDLGGVWNGCASPCRHSPDAEICIESCDVVCIL